MRLHLIRIGDHQASGKDRAPLTDLSDSDAGEGSATLRNGKCGLVWPIIL
ncbi:hypothetical protein ABC347_05945 [Sphingomonas sp. 1P06PA]